MSLHLDTAKLSAVLEATDDRALRVLLGVLALAPDGVLIGQERRLASRCGLSGPRELGEVLARLAATVINGAPLVARDTVKGQPRVKVVGPPGWLINHAARPLPATPRAPSAPRRIAPRQTPEQSRDAVAAALVAQHPELGQLADAWVAHLASLTADKLLPLGVQLNQYRAVLKMAARYGEVAVAAALAAGIKKTDLDNPTGSPQNYLEAVAAREFAAGAGNKQRKSFVARPTIAKDDLF